MSYRTRVKLSIYLIFLTDQLPNEEFFIFITSSSSLFERHPPKLFFGFFGDCQTPNEDFIPFAKSERSRL